MNNDQRPFPGPNARTNREEYKLTPEELRTLKECNVESFYKRCLPIGAFLASSTYLGVKNGFLKPSPRYGPTPKVLISVVIGYFIGKFSYQSKCAEKLMQLPNSHLGELLRQKRRGNRQDTFDTGFGPGLSLAPFGNVSSSDMYSDLNPNTSLDIDTSRPDNPGLDDYHRPSLDNPIYEEEEMPPIQKNTTSYDELRKKNREDYTQRRLGNYRETAQPHISPPSAPQKQDGFLPEKEINGDSKPTTPINKYGDVWG